MKMEHKIYMNYIHPSSLLRQLAVLWRSDQLCDAVITVDKIIVSKAHKLVLFAISPKLSVDAKTSSQSPILDVCLPSGVTHKAVHAFLQYMYEGYLILTYDIAPDLLKIARFLEIKCLSNCCSDFVNYMKSKEDIVLVDESDVAKESNTDEFNHVRQSSVKEGQLPPRPSKDSHSESGSKRHRLDDRQNDSPSKGVDRTPSSSPFDSHSHSSKTPEGSTAKRKLVGSGDRDSSGKKRPYLVQGVQSDNVMSDLDLDWGVIKSHGGRDIKVENTEDDQDGYGEMHMHDNQENQHSLKMTDSSAPIDVDLIDIKEEPEEVLVEQNFLSSISSTSTPGGNQGQFGDDSMPQMWFSADTGTVQALNQTAPVSMNSPVGMPQRSMTPSLKQIRAQQSIKRSIQSSVSAARRARNIQMAGASVSASASASGEDNQQLDASGEAPGAGSQEKPFMCPVCGQGFGYKGNYRRHVESQHSTTFKPYKCDVCGKLYRQKSNLKEHQNTHLQVKPYNCQFCSNSYYSPTGIRGHMKKMHNWNPV